MKTLIWLCALTLALASVSFAQHCPFDGFRMIVVHLTDAQNKPVNNAEINLREIDNPQADGCKHSKGLLNKDFSPVKTLLDDYLKVASINNASNEFCADCRFLGAGYYGVILTQGERNCLFYNGDTLADSLTRKFEIRYGGQKLAVKESRIYRLCLAEGKWSRIKPINLQVKSIKKTSNYQNKKLNK